MIAEGLAHHYVYRAPSQYAADYDYTQADAQANARGLWSPETCNGMAYPKRDLEDPLPSEAQVGAVVNDGNATPTVIPAPMATPVPAVVPAATRAPAAASSSGFDPAAYIGKGDAFNCKDFKSQADAQAVLRADPRDPNKLDVDRDGVACESNRGPFDRVPVKR